METFRVDIVTPERLVYSDRATMVTVPATEGQMGLLAGHASILSTLDEGAVLIDDGSGNSKSIAITGGIVDMQDNVCVILAEAIASRDTDHDYC